MSAYVGVIDLPGPVPVPDGLLDKLADEVRSVCPQPIDVLQVAALLETAGITDNSALQRYGHASVFDLAQSVLRRLAGPPPLSGELVRVPAPAERRWQAALDYLRGPLTLVPMVLLSVVIMAYQEFGQWGAGRVLALSLSVVGSLLVTSGFVQAASRKGSSYLSQGYIDAARRTVGRVMGLGLATICLAAALLAAVAVRVAAAPPDAVAMMTIAFVALSCLWLAAGVLFMLNQVHWFGIGLAVGVGLICALLRGLALLTVPRGWVMLAATAIGFAGALLVMLVVIWRSLAQRTSASPVGKHRVVLPALPHLVINLAPYFVYGVLYVLLVLAGHISGWIGRTPQGIGRMDAVTTTEIGLTLALGGVILAGGVAERTIARFWRLVKVHQLEAVVSQPAHFRQAIAAFVACERRRFAFVLLLCSTAVVGVAAALVGWSAHLDVAFLPWSRQTTVVLVWGTVGYGLMALGVFECMFMITLSRPGMAIQAVMLGIATTVLVGLVIGQLAAFHTSAVGLVAGNLVFLAAAHRNLGVLLKHTDYFYYASF